MDLGVSCGSSPLATELDENNTLDERRDVIHAYTVQGINITFAPYDTAMFLFIDAKLHVLEFRGSPRTSMLKRGNPCRKQKIDQ